MRKGRWEKIDISGKVFVDVCTTFKGKQQTATANPFWCTVIWTTGHSSLVKCKPTQPESKKNITWKEDRKLDVWQIHALPYIIDHSSRIMSIKKRTKVCYQHNRKRRSQVDSQASLRVIFCTKMNGTRLSWITAFLQSSLYEVHMNREFIYLWDHRTRASIFPYIYKAVLPLDMAFDQTYRKKDTNTKALVAGSEIKALIIFGLWTFISKRWVIVQMHKMPNYMG